MDNKKNVIRFPEEAGFHFLTTPETPKLKNYIQLPAPDSLSINLIQLLTNTTYKLILKSNHYYIQVNFTTNFYKE